MKVTYISVTINHEPGADDKQISRDIESLLAGEREPDNVEVIETLEVNE